MGKSQSKEEVIIAQAGNSGGESTKVGSGNFSMGEVCSIIAIVLSLGVFIYLMVQWIMKRIQKKIRTEIRRSQELI